MSADRTPVPLSPERLAEAKNLLRYESSISFHSARAKETMLLLLAEAERRQQDRAEVLNEAADAAAPFHGDYAPVVAAWLRRMADGAGKDASTGPQPGAGESIQPADFFQPGRTYTDREVHQYGWKFRVDTIITHPEDGERTALGWRCFNGTWEPYSYGEDDWEILQFIGHIDTTEGGVA